MTAATLYFDDPDEAPEEPSVLLEPLESLEPLVDGIEVEPLDEVSGLVVELLLDELEGLLLEPLAPLLAPASELKKASHSIRDTWLSPSLSAEEKLGVAPLAPLAALPPADSVLLEELDGVLLEPLAPAPAEPLVCVSLLPLAPAPAEPLDEVEGVLVEPLAPALSLDCAPVLPAASLLPSAKATPESANSAAAVAVARIFSFMC